MQRLVQLDIVPRFRYDTAKKNPYFCEATKYAQIYIEIFQKFKLDRAKVSEKWIQSQANGMYVIPDPMDDPFLLFKKGHSYH